MTHRQSTGTVDLVARAIHETHERFPDVPVHALVPVVVRRGHITETTPHRRTLSVAHRLTQRHPEIPADAVADMVDTIFRDFPDVPIRNLVPVVA